MNLFKFLFLSVVGANYEVISSKHFREFQEKVSLKIMNGNWELVGGVEAIKIGFSVTYLQAVKSKHNSSIWY